MKTTIEIAADLRKGNVKNIFNAIDGKFAASLTGHGTQFEYDDVADTILDLVYEYAEGFVKDIAKRFRFNGELAGRCMSDKQRWCVAFAFQKITDENVAAYTELCKNC